MWYLTVDGRHQQKFISHLGDCVRSHERCAQEQSEESGAGRQALDYWERELPLGSTGRRCEYNWLI